jgi:hypothetical protein
LGIGAFSSFTLSFFFLCIDLALAFLIVPRVLPKHRVLALPFGHLKDIFNIFFRM